MLLLPAQVLTGWSLAPSVATDAPVLVGARLDLETPHRIRASITGGVMIEPYVDLINAVVVKAGGYEAETAALIESSLSTSMVLRFHVGWRPFEEWGFFFSGGYTLIALGGSTSAADVIAAGTGREPPDNDGALQLDVRSTLHLLGFEAGWEWLLVEGLVLRATIGFLGTVASNTSIEPKRETRFGAVDTFTEESAAYLDDVYQSYVFTPTLSLSVGWSFAF